MVARIGRRHRIPSPWSGSAAACLWMCVQVGLEIDGLIFYACAGGWGFALIAVSQVDVG
jgi:hypothetical protein